MVGVTLLVLAAVGVRLAGAAGRGHSAWAVSRVGGWILCALAVWFAAGALGAWSPVWPLLVIGVAGGVIANWLRGETLRLAGDALAAIIVAAAAVPPLDLGQTAALAIAAVVAGLLLDQFVGRLPRLIRLAGFGIVSAAVVVAAAGLVFNFLLGPPTQAWYSDGAFATVGVAGRGALGERIDLATGATGWLVQPQGDSTGAVALVFHGADAGGSHQSSARVLARALSAAGFAVLLVDHPGYGHSPTPAFDAPVEGWNPLPTHQAALHTMREMFDPTVCIVVGHSMGSNDALRLAAAEGDSIDAVLLLGSALFDVEERAEYWHKRFHSDRRLKQQLPSEKVLEIRRAYYHTNRSVDALTADHPPIVFVRLGLEWENLAHTQDELYQRLPGQKMLWHLARATHQLSSTERGGVLIGDVNVARNLAEELSNLRQMLESR